MAFLGEEGVSAAFEFLALALELGELQHPTQVGLQEPFALAFGVGDGLADVLESRLQHLWQPLASVRPP